MRALLLLVPLALSACSDAKEGATPPHPELALTGRVVDNANIFDADFEQELNAKLAALEGDTGVQLVVASTPDLEGYSINDYSYELANSWGIGSAERDDGLLLLVAPKERRVRIEVGYGLEASVRDEEAGEIIREAIIPEFRKNDFEAGVMNGVESLIDEVTPYGAKPTEMKPKDLKEAA